MSRISLHQRLVLHHRAGAVETVRAPWHTLDASFLLQRHDHLVHRRSRDPKIALHICFGWRLTIEFGVVINERQVLPLTRRVIAWHHAELPLSMSGLKLDVEVHYRRFSNSSSRV